MSIVSLEQEIKQNGVTNIEASSVGADGFNPIKITVNVPPHFTITHFTSGYDEQESLTPQPLSAFTYTSTLLSVSVPPKNILVYVTSDSLDPSSITFYTVAILTNTSTFSSLIQNVPPNTYYYLFTHSVSPVSGEVSFFVSSSPTDFVFELDSETSAFDVLRLSSRLFSFDFS